jgi:hypothetical protein
MKQKLQKSWILNIHSSLIVENGTYAQVTFLTGTSGVRFWSTNIKSLDNLYKHTETNIAHSISSEEEPTLSKNSRTP